MPDMPELPPAGEWKLYIKGLERNGCVGVVRVDLIKNTGSLEYQGQSAPLSNVARHGNAFTAEYSVGRFQGRLVAARESTTAAVNFRFIGAGQARINQLVGQPLPIDVMARIATDFKGTYDLAGAAVAVWRVSPRAVQWSNDGSDFVDAVTVTDLLKVRRMCCYEFVHFAAYLAGQQQVFDSGNPKVSGATNVISSWRYVIWDGKTTIPKGKIAVGVARAFNNSAGFYHVGISLGDGRIISLSSGTNIHIETAGCLFDSVFYKEVRVADYNWAVAQAEFNVPMLPPFVQPK